MVDGHAELVWCGLKISGLMDPDEAIPGARDMWYEGRSSVEMAELTSPTFFLFPSLTVAWAFWVLEGLHLLALKGFSREQLHVSTIILVLMALPLKVTWSLYVPSGVWEQTGCPWLRGTLLVERKKEGDFVISLQCVFLTQHFFPSCRGRSSKPSSFHPLEHCDHDLHLLFGIFWCLSGIHPCCALPPDSASRPFATNCSPELVAPRQILRDYWDPL